MGDFLFSVSCVSCSRRYSGDSPFPLPFSLFPSSRFCPRCPVRATSVSASPSFDISYFVISAFSVVLCARVLRAHLSLRLSIRLSPRLSIRLSLRPFLRHCMPACLYVPSAGCHPFPFLLFRRHLLLLSAGFLLLFRRMSSGLGLFTCAAPHP